ASGCRLARLPGKAEMPVIAVEAAGAMPQTNDGAFTDGLRTLRVIADERPQHLAIPALRMFDIEHSMEGEIKSLFSGYPQPLEPGIDKASPRGCCHLNHAKRPDRLKAIAAAARQSQHCISERKRLGHNSVGLCTDIEIIREPSKQRAMHGSFPAATHFVPIVPRHLQFDGDGHLHLGQREKVVE